MDPRGKYFRKITVLKPCHMLVKIQLQNLNQTSASKSQLNFNFNILTKPQPRYLEQYSASKSLPICCQHVPHHQNLHTIGSHQSSCISVQIHVRVRWKNLNFPSYKFGKGAVCFLPHIIIAFCRKIKFVENTIWVRKIIKVNLFFFGGGGGSGHPNFMNPF